MELMVWAMVYAGVQEVLRRSRHISPVYGVGNVNIRPDKKG